MGNRANSALANNSLSHANAATRVYEQHINSQKNNKSKMNNRSNTIEVLVGPEKEPRKAGKQKLRSTQNSIDGLYGKPKSNSQMGNYGARQMQSTLTNYQASNQASFNAGAGNSLNRLPIYGNQPATIANHQQSQPAGSKVRRKRDFSQVIDPTTSKNVLGTNLTGGAGSQQQPGANYGNIANKGGSPQKLGKGQTYANDAKATTQQRDGGNQNLYKNFLEGIQIKDSTTTQPGNNKQFNTIATSQNSQNMTQGFPDASASDH
jgi:hypothetical protein